MSLAFPDANGCTARVHVSFEGSGQTLGDGGGARERARAVARADGAGGVATGCAVTSTAVATAGGADGVAGWNGDVTCV